MIEIKILEGTTINPLQCIGSRAGICCNADISNTEKNIERARDCIVSGHGRVLEFVNVEFVVTGISARAARELYTHIGGSPTRLQESTRYISYENFDYYSPLLPDTVKVGLKNLYDEAMKSAARFYRDLLNAGMSKEDAANVLPLGMATKVVMKTSLRMLENLMNQRLCSRAYKEMREFSCRLYYELMNLNNEWKEICVNLFVPKCLKYGYCTENKSCNSAVKKETKWRKFV